MNTQELCELLSDKTHGWRIIKKKESLESSDHDMRDEVFIRAVGKSGDGKKLTLEITITDVICSVNQFILSFERIHTVVLEEEYTYNEPERGLVTAKKAKQWREKPVGDLPDLLSEINNTYGRVKAGT